MSDEREQLGSWEPEPGAFDVGENFFEANGRRSELGSPPQLCADVREDRDQDHDHDLHHGERREKTDLGNAEAFATEHSHRLRYVKERKQWHVYGGGRWLRDTTGHAERAAKDTVRAMLRHAADIEDDDQRQRAVRHAMASQSDARVRAMISLATTEPEIVLDAEGLDRNPYLLGVGNGVIDLCTGRLRASDPADLISLGTNVPYDPAATAPRWKRFLEEIFSGDHDLIQYFHRFTGYCLTGDTREQVVTVYSGSGGNGKDTALKPILRVLGDLAQTCPFDTFTRARGDRGVRNDLARLHRARLVVASESGEGKRLDEPVVKLVSGGGRIAARFLYGEYFEYTPNFKIVLVTNARPRVDGDDEAIWRRLRLVPFEASFVGREDKQLDTKLEAELPGILTWAVQGCLEWQRDGLRLPTAVERATTEYRRDEDVLGAFIAERCLLEGEYDPSALRDAYANYCKDIGEHPLAANTLGKRLSRRGIKRGGRRNAYLGICPR